MKHRKIAILILASLVAVPLMTVLVSMVLFTSDPNGKIKTFDNPTDIKALYGDTVPNYLDMLQGGGKESPQAGDSVVWMEFKLQEMIDGSTVIQDMNLPEPTDTQQCNPSDTREVLARGKNPRDKNMVYCFLRNTDGSRSFTIQKTW